MRSGNYTADKELLALNKHLLKAGKKDATKFLYSYLDREDAIVECLKRINGVKSEIYLREADNHLGEQLRFSSIFSDLTILNTASSVANATEVTSFRPESPYWRDRKLSFPRVLLPEMGADPSQFNACYINRPDAAIKKLFTSYAPLIKEGRLLIRPLRGLYVNHPGANAGTIYYVDPNTPNEHWHINQVEDKGSIFIDNGLDQLQMVKLFELTIPFFDGIPIENLAKVLQDETLVLSTFRAQLIKMVREAGENMGNLSVMRNDIIRPAIDTLERRFKTIAGTHRITTVGSVSSFTLTLVIATISGNLMQVLTGAVPTVGGALLLSERAYRDKMTDLKDNPFFLLWRIARER